MDKRPRRYRAVRGELRTGDVQVDLASITAVCSTRAAYRPRPTWWRQPPHGWSAAAGGPTGLDTPPTLIGNDPEAFLPRVADGAGGYITKRAAPSQRLADAAGREITRR